MEGTYVEDFSTLFEALESEDGEEVLEAFERVSTMVMDQGTPGPHASEIVGKLRRLVESRHSLWLDLACYLDHIMRDLSFGPMRSEPENQARIALLDQLRSYDHLAEELLRSDCTGGDDCRVHEAAASIASMILPQRGEWVASVLIDLIRRDPGPHAQLWNILDSLRGIGGLPDELLRYCLSQSKDESVRRVACIELAARRDSTASEQLRRWVSSTLPPVFEVQLSEMDLFGRVSCQLPLDLLSILFHRASNVQVMHLLASGALRSATGDQRSGWDVVVQRRRPFGMTFRHLEVHKQFDPSVSVIATRVRHDLNRHPLGFAMDTDLWTLYGL